MEPLIGYVLGLIVGLVLLGVAAFLYIKARNFVNAAQKTKGTVVRMEPRTRKGGTSYVAVFEFRSLDGQTITVLDTVAARPPRHQVGQAVDVVYDPANPRDARLDSTSTLYMMPIIIGVVGGMLTLTNAGRVVGELVGLLFR